ncbi:MAG: hypothetical protein ACE5ID_04865, partial [Acidobacteriota bacterium]
MDGNDRRGAGLHINPAQLAAGPEDQGAAVRRPGDGRRVPLAAVGLLEIPIELLVERPLQSRFQILDEQGGGHGRRAAHEGQAPPVGRRRRPHGAAGTVHQNLGAAFFAVQALDDEDLAGGVLVVLPHPAGGGVLAEIDVAAIGGEHGGRHGLLILLLVGALGQLHAAAAPHMEHPDLFGRDAPRGGERLG